MPSQVRKKSKAVCFMGRNQEADLEAYHGKAWLGCWAQGLFFTNHIPRGRRIYIQVRSSVSGPAPSPLLQKKLLPKQCFTRLRAIKGTWKEEKWGKRNGSVRKQKPSSSAWVSAIKCCETVPCWEGMPCSHSMSPFPHPSGAGICGRISFESCKTKGSAVCMRMSDMQTETAEEKRQLFSARDRDFWNTHNVHLYPSNLKLYSQ